MNYTVSKLNKASVITLDAKDFLKIKIDKKSGEIIEVFRFGKKENRDITKEILAIDTKYTVGNKIMRTPYTLGVVLKKLFNGDVNNKCKKALKIFDNIILED